MESLSIPEVWCPVPAVAQGAVAKFRHILQHRRCFPRQHPSLWRKGIDAARLGIDLHQMAEGIYIFLPVLCPFIEF